MLFRGIISVVSAMVLLSSAFLAAISIIHEEVESFDEVFEPRRFFHNISGTIIPQRFGRVFDRDGNVLLDRVDFSVSDISFHSVPSNRFTPPRPVQNPPLLDEYRLSGLEYPACFYVKISCNGFVLELRNSSGVSLGRVPLQTLRKLPGSISEFRDNPYLGLDGRFLEDGGVVNLPRLSSLIPDNRSVAMYETYFEGYVFDPPDYASYAVFKDGIELFVVERSEHAPIAGLTGFAEGQIFGEDGYIELSLSAWDEDGDDLVYDIFLTRKLNDYGIFSRTITEEVVVSDEIRIPNSFFNVTGLARIGVSVSDGTRSVFVESPVFRINDRPPKVRIISPVENEKPRYSMCPNSFRAAETCLLLAASGRDPEESSGLSNSNYSWSSNIDGQLGTGRYPAIPVEQLTFGEHTITVTFTNNQGEFAVDSLDIIIQEDDINQISDN